MTDTRSGGAWSRWFPQPTQYYGGVYWNSYAEVIGHINRRVSGDDDVDVWEWFHQQTGRTFRRALVINCGNGWVERC